MTNDDLEALVSFLPCIVEWQKDERGIAVRPVDQPMLESIVEMPADIRDKVWEWLHNPKLVEDKEEWMQLRKPIISVLLEITKIIAQYGHPVHREIFSEILKESSKSC